MRSRTLIYRPFNLTLPDHEILVTIWEDGSVDVARRAFGESTWGPPWEQTLEEERDDA